MMTYGVKIANDVEGQGIIRLIRTQFFVSGNLLFYGLASFIVIVV